ncbi:hypothetical protein OS493_015342 [Desmophyllum pertusum]|uniref:Uncharacterized protein n=1 Tax=Desmophyllum pertusum TaxID=174260 RepID=A0A9W9ZDA1_9CNID|nr:hypothetical protein OS493_015342 [Desmophyllum pertusum]
MPFDTRHASRQENGVFKRRNAPSSLRLIFIFITEKGNFPRGRTPNCHFISGHQMNDTESGTRSLHLLTRDRMWMMSKMQQTIL